MAGLWEIHPVRKRILELHAEGADNTEIADDIGIKRDTVGKLLLANGIKPNPHKYEKPSKYVERYEETLRLSALDYSVPRIARLLGITDRQVQRYRSRADVPRPARQQITQEKLDRALEFLKDGTGYAEAARSVGCKPSTLSHRFPGYAMSVVERNQMITAIREATRANPQLERLGL